MQSYAPLTVFLPKHPVTRPKLCDVLVEEEKLDVQGLVDEAVSNIKLYHTKYYSFIIKRTKNNKSTIIYDGKWKEIISDCPEEGSYVYSVIPLFYNNRFRL